MSAAKVYSIDSGADSLHGPNLTACMQVICPPAPMPKKMDPHDSMGTDPADQKGQDSGNFYGKKGPGDMKKKEQPTPPPCYTVQVGCPDAGMI